jgi:hypothetical protein
MMILPAILISPRRQADTQRPFWDSTHKRPLANTRSVSTFFGVAICNGIVNAVAHAATARSTAKPDTKTPHHSASYGYSSILCHTSQRNMLCCDSHRDHVRSAPRTHARAIVSAPAPTLQLWSKRAQLGLLSWPLLSLKCRRKLAIM